MRSIVYAQSAEGCTRLTGSGPVGDAFRAGHASAVGAAVEVTVRLDAVPDHLDAAILASRSQGVDSTLEAVEGMRVATGHTHLESLVVIVAADFTLGHGSTPSLRLLPLDHARCQGIAICPYTCRRAITWASTYSPLRSANRLWGPSTSKPNFS